MPLLFLIISIVFLGIIVAVQIILNKVGVLETRSEWKVILLCLTWVFLFVAILMLVYCAFYYHWGFPPGSDLQNSDWLAFLSGYLGFSGALIMAWLVYKQDKTINQLTAQEYRVTFKPVADYIELAQHSEINEEEIFVALGNAKKLYVKQDVMLDSKKCTWSNDDSHNPIPFIYLSIINVGRLKVDKLHFDSLEIVPPQIQETGAKTPSLYYSFCEESGGNILNGSHRILPNSSFRICLIPDHFPIQLSLSILKLSFHYFIGEHEESQSIEMLIQLNALPVNKVFLSDWETEVSSISKDR